ncbi:chemotaxis protein [Helicobacter saguini]|uniref:Chemotaxis protein n=1 Tax=Helicobacter saguini TaxID=1548018 RepID=A0A347VTK0_9HELI|nr:chemotaxis protein [Helicobacter saguini]MWV62063.1 chemotaxis protein [Helicobacter saguini]MWV67263.1 chemotaxis protein [Helicobacter saguini]MWV69617.1 chemotaxis protein [Helicobacter saguini]MWV70833.1 chemotaxis protein [Helicobacter saguini]TLD94328.1 chemotaxis protein [Helicobacter saguini]
MTQDELDSMMKGGVDNLPLDAASEPAPADENIKPEFVDPNTYKPEADKKWPPPPPTEEHKVVHQLDDVTKDSEIKMSEVFDQIDSIGSSVSKIEKDSKKIVEYLKTQEEMLVMLVDSFPKIKAFATSLEQTKGIKAVVDDIKNLAMDCNDACMQAMDIMQYQDIHRQKIERVINVMRALSQYMNSLFEGRGDDSKRVASATYIAGDNHDEVASEGDIEALIASFGKK